MCLFLHPSVGNTELCLGCCYWLKSLLISRHSLWRNTTPVCMIMISVCLFLLQQALSFCCSDIPYAAYRNISQVLTVLSYRCFSRETYNIFPCWLNSLISIMRTICWRVQEVLCHWEIASRNARFECIITKCASYAKSNFYLYLVLDL